MTKEEFAALLEGRQYLQEMTKEDDRLAEENGLIVVFGYSDDGVEFHGRYNDDFGAFNGRTFYLLSATIDYRIVTEADLIDSGWESHFPPIVAEWSPETPVCSWLIRTELPHARFNIFEGDELFCVGIVIDLKELA